MSEEMSAENKIEQPEIAPSESQKTKKVFLVDNPVSGTTDAATRRETYKAHFDAHQWECELYETSPNENLALVIHDAVQRGFTLVVACGGDGTVAGVASGVIHSETPMAIIPAGTGNMLARDLGIPLRIDRALELITSDNQVMHLDAMQVRGKTYLLNLGVGLSSKIMANAGRESKRRFGMLAYVWAAIVQLTGFRLRSFTVQVDDQTLTQRASEVLLVNSSIIGIQRLQKWLEFKPDDGFIDVCIVRARTALDLLPLLMNVFLGSKKLDSRVRCNRASRKIVINSNRRLTVQADGEVIGVTPVEVTVIPGALRVLVPKAPE